MSKTAGFAHGSARNRRPVRFLVALAATITAAIIVGVPTRIIPTPLFTRMTPVRWWDYPFWIVSSVLAGAIVATYVPKPGPKPRVTCQTRTIGGSLLSAFAIGCPACNKIVVAVIGISGALTYFAPLQPFLGGVSVILLGSTLCARLRQERSLPPT
jgi:hypothetical protein